MAPIFKGKYHDFKRFRILEFQEKEKSLMSLRVFFTVSVKLMCCKSLLFM